MNDVEAYQILASELAQFRSLSYAELVQFVGPSTSRRIRGRDSTEYATEINVRWRSGVPGDIVFDGWIAVYDCGPVRRLDDVFVVSAPAKD
jgi:hypothetical protein